MVFWGKIEALLLYGNNDKNTIEESLPNSSLSFSRIRNVAIYSDRVHEMYAFQGRYCKTNSVSTSVSRT